jgi:hypothetical protein
VCAGLWCSDDSALMQATMLQEAVARADGGCDMHACGPTHVGSEWIL